MEQYSSLNKIRVYVKKGLTRRRFKDGFARRKYAHPENGYGINATYEIFKKTLLCCFFM